MRKNQIFLLSVGVYFILSQTQKDVCNLCLCRTFICTIKQEGSICHCYFSLLVACNKYTIQDYFAKLIYGPSHFQFISVLSADALSSDH